MYESWIYVDDMCLLASTAIAMQQLLNICKDYVVVIDINEWIIIFDNHMIVVFLFITLGQCLYYILWHYLHVLSMGLIDLK